LCDVRVAALWHLFSQAQTPLGKEKTSVDEQAGHSQLDPHQSGSGEDPQLGRHHHERFPTPEELDASFGEEVVRFLDAELAISANERHLARIARQQPSALIGPPPDTLPSVGGNFRTSVTQDMFSGVTLGATPVALGDFLPPRVNQKFLDQTERDQFNRALQKAHQVGTYQPLAAIHADHTHRMHTMHGGAIGTQRFLPWHRFYLLECEKLLRRHEPLVRIPYWNYADDHERPDWVWQPPNVVRGTPGGSGGSLPTRQTIDNILQNTAYTGFTYALERDGHNGVHNWCNGTITNPDTAPQDPIFWLLHANVDYIWNRWQADHSGVPLLSGLDAVLDPWQATAADVDSVVKLGYRYKSTLASSIFGAVVDDTLPSPVHDPLPSP